MSTAPATLRDERAQPGMATAMPPWIYQNATMNRLELERILRPSWQIAGHVNSVPRPGDYLTFELGPDSLVMLRDRDGGIRVFHNVCRHRGTRLLDGQGNCPGRITCPYHGWTYRDDGTLLATPVKDSFPTLDRAQYGLRPVKTDVFLGFVFVCLTGAPPPVREIWGELAEELAPYRMEEMVPLGPVTTERWEADWKVAMDNYLESYHVPIGHPGLNRMFTPDYEDQKGVPWVARGASWMRPQPSSRWSERFYQKLAPGLATHLPEPNRRCWRFYSMLPNLGIDVYPEQMDFFQVLPDGPGKCIIRGGVFGLPDDRREIGVARWLNNRIGRSINNEDHWLCARVQRGIASSGYQPGPLSTIESWMLEFHDLIRERIPETRSSEPPAQFR
jgi:phenylpropionate dioxygenase-like ring-hydroxylating dioxygenase large terminal subunit